MMTRALLLCLSVFLCTRAPAQDALTYQTPPASIMQLVDVPLAPRVLMDHERNNMLLLYRDAYKSIADLSQTELRLAGLRIDPKTNIGSRTNYYNDVKVRAVDGAEGSERPLAGLPQNARLANLTWSPDETMVALTHTTDEGVELWVADLATATARRLTEARLNANMGDAINWAKDGKSIIVKLLPDDRQPLIDGSVAVPTGPTISTADGKKAQNRTYQDLLSNPNDEANFEQVARANIVRVTLDGTVAELLPTAMYADLRVSPDGKYLLVETIERPFSYLVPYYRFPTTTVVYDNAGKQVAVVAEQPLVEDLPQGFMATITGRRSIDWRADLPATLTYAEALDGGDPAIEVEYRDALYSLAAPFTGEGTDLLKTKNRYAGVLWGDAQTALAYDNWFDTRNAKVYVFDPSGTTEPTELYDRNYQDRYSDPGQPVTTRNAYGREVLALEDGAAFMIGDGFTETGQFPFLHRVGLRSGETTELYVSSYTDKLEELLDYDLATQQLLVREESPIDYPNYYFRELEGWHHEAAYRFRKPLREP